MLCGVAFAIVALGVTDASAQPSRPTVGIAFGGGSARGIAHIGLIQWFEENHIPIDTAAGTSMRPKLASPDHGRSGRAARSSKRR